MQEEKPLIKHQPAHPPESNYPRFLHLQSGEDKSDPEWSDAPFIIIRSTQIEVMHPSNKHPAESSTNGCG
jgi:hypothetical protein